ncbi:hypothetical protein Ddye_001827 [Dipteronia dyeriana]|uniref:G3BP-like protein n=1 Tax=Dipteronia dyeriana TaxID=168575 RepID=A0AAE0CUD3_9ROSI|nr:hypothetical protein Ddye_001827 [Dipteronia dyeriana]
MNLIYGNVIIFKVFFLLFGRMALQAASPPSGQVVGNAFVEQYYHILHNSPELVYRFYQDSSVLSRPDSNGVMTSVTTMEGINQKILSMDFKNYKAEINTADAQNSHKEGVTVLVTGCLTGKDNLRRKFAQSFFLAPQDNGYYVLNDVFRYVEDGKVLDKYPVNIVDNSHVVNSFSDPESARVPDPPAADHTSHVAEDQNIYEEPTEHERRFQDEKEVLESQSHEVEKDVSAMVESVPSSAQEDASKKSYASIVKVTEGSSGPNEIYVPANTAKMTPKKTENQSLRSATPASHSETSAPVSTNIPESSNAHDEAESCSIYIRNLPFNITVAELEVELKKFGPIKQGGIQVRHNKDFFFGFVKFQSSSSMENAIQASPVTIGGQEAVVEKKKYTRVGGGRGRHSFERKRFRNDNFRQHGNGGGRGYGRNEYGNWGEFCGQGWGSAGRRDGGDDYQRGRGRGGSSGGPKQKAVISA